MARITSIASGPSSHPAQRSRLACRQVVTTGQHRDHCTRRDRALQDSVAQGATRVTRHDASDGARSNCETSRATNETRRSSRGHQSHERRMQSGARRRQPWIDHDGLRRRVVEQDHQVREQTGFRRRRQRLARRGAVAGRAVRLPMPRTAPCAVGSRHADRARPKRSNKVSPGKRSRSCSVSRLRDACANATLEEYPLHAIATFARRESSRPLKCLLSVQGLDLGQSPHRSVPCTSFCRDITPPRS